MAFQKDTLWDSTVLNLVLNDVNGIIIKVVVDCALSDAIVLIGILNNWFLEISFELKDLPKKQVLNIISFLKYNNLNTASKAAVLKGDQWDLPGDHT